MSEICDNCSGDGCQFCETDGSYKDLLDEHAFIEAMDSVIEFIDKLDDDNLSRLRDYISSLLPSTKPLEKSEEKASSSSSIDISGLPIGGTEKIPVKPARKIVIKK